MEWYRGEHRVRHKSADPAPDGETRQQTFVLGATFFVVDFFAVAVFVVLVFVLSVSFLAVDFLKSADSLYEFLIWTKSPAVTPVLSALRKCAFNHFLSLGRFSCMCFLMEMRLDPFLSFRSRMATTMPCLYDMMMIDWDEEKRRIDFVRVCVRNRFKRELCLRGPQFEWVF